MSGEEEQRIKTIDDRFNALEEKIEGIIGRLTGHGGGEPVTSASGDPDEGNDIGAQVRAELARAREEEAAERRAAEAAEADQSERQQMREDLAKLKEKPPAAPAPRRTRMLGWGDPR